MLKTQLAVFRWTQKSALRDGLNVTGKNGLMPFPLPPDMSKDFCINPLIKITIQSKALFTKALHSNTVPNTAFDRQTLPHAYNGKNIHSSLYQISGRNSIRADRLTAFRNAGNPESLTTGLQKCKSSGVIAWRLASNQDCPPECRITGTQEWRLSRLIAYRNECRPAVSQTGNQEFRQDCWLSCKEAWTKSGTPACP